MVVCRWADTKKASQWLSRNASDVHWSGISTKRLANIINSFEKNQFPEEKIRLQRIFNEKSQDVAAKDIAVRDAIGEIMARSGIAVNDRDGQSLIDEWERREGGYT